ncbi:MAG: DUF4910 domain-containing protein [Planctomycetes bacterium]|nr:DUF4910 domain-containing protein [Planctomycetota bacterium]
MTRRGVFPTAAAVLLLAAALPGQTAHLLDARTRDVLHEELSGELAKEHVIAITRSHRVQGSRGYREAAQYVLQQLRAAGYDEHHAWIESFPSDGKVTYQTWQSPSGWDVDRAELRMVSPSDERIVGYPEIAMSLVTYSNPGDVTAPLVFVGRGESDADYVGKDVAGKFVLATGYGGTVHRKAVLERGAAAVVCYLDDARAAEHPDMLQYTGMWPRTDELARVTFGFDLTHRQGDRLRRLLKSGQDVVLHGSVEGTGLEPFFMDVVVAQIDGAELPDESLLLSAHLDHPKESANDNASGSAALLDMARALRTLVDGGRLPRPRRTLRFVWVPEFYGTMAWIDAHDDVRGPALGGKVLANVNMDMVGEDLEQLHCHFYATRTLDSAPSVLDDVVLDMCGLVAETDVRTPRGSRSDFNWRQTPYAPGSDHMVFLDRKIPATMFGHDPDYSHHTSDDTPDKVDPVELERCELLAAGTLLVLSDLDEARAADLAWLTAARAAGDLGDAGRRAFALVADAPDAGLASAWIEAQNVLDHGSRFASEAVASVLTFRGGERPRAAVSGAATALSRQWTALSDALRAAAAARGLDVEHVPAGEARDARVAVRTTRGPLADDVFARRLPSERAAWYGAGAPSGDVRFEILNFVDGKRSVSDVRDAVAAEFGALAVADVAHFLDDLAELGLVTWR